MASRYNLDQKMDSERLDKLYTTYIKNYGERKVKAFYQGVEMRVRFTKLQFEVVYRTEFKRKKLAGERTNNIMQNIVNGQVAWKMSIKQAKSIREYYKKKVDRSNAHRTKSKKLKYKDEVPSISDLRTGKFEPTSFYDKIKQQYADMKSGKIRKPDGSKYQTAKERKEKIAEWNYDSP